MKRWIVVGMCLVFFASPAFGQRKAANDRPELIVERFQIELARLRKNVGDVTCWIRSTSWKVLTDVRVKAEMIGTDGSVKSFSIGVFPKLPPGRVVEGKQKVKGLPEIEKYRVILWREGRKKNSKYVYEGQVDQTKPELVSAKSGSSESDGDNRGSGTSYPEKLEVGMDTPFQKKNELELGHMTFWKTGKETMLVRGGLRNGRDHAVTETTITFTLPGTDGGTVKRKLTIDNTLKSGEVYPFEHEFEGIGDGSMGSYEFSFQTDSSITETVSMTWSDVRDKLSESPKSESRANSETRQTGAQSQQQYPLLALRGMEVVEGREPGREGITDVYLLKIRLQVNGSPIRPTGKLKFIVYEGDQPRLKETQTIRPDRIEPVPSQFDVNSLEPGIGYWDEKNGVLYHALFKIVDIHSDVRLDVFIETGRTGRWTFKGLQSPFMNSPIPPDQVR